MSMVPCLTWVRRGKAKAKPDVVKLDKEELKRLIEETERKLEDAEEAESEGSDEENVENAENNTEGATASDRNTSVKPKKAPKRKKTVEEEYKMDDYDDEDEEVNPLYGIGNLTIYADNKDDPYVTLKDDDDSDNEDFEIKSTDNLIVYGKVEDEMCTLEVHVYNESLGNLYCHHELLLPTFPLVVEWLDYDIGEPTPGNFVAVGGMEPHIDIWDLDVMESLEPICTLGGSTKSSKKKKSGAGGHTDAILDLSWNSVVRTALASASADFTVGLWDLSEGKMVTSIKQHKEKVQCVQWHPHEPQSLISGSFDHTVKVYDCRSPHNTNKTWKLGGEIEAVLWDRFNPLNFFASTETGQVFYMDSRQDKPLYTVAAHTDSVPGLAQSCSIPGVLATCSSDHTLKIWDVINDKPTMVVSRDLQLGQLHCLRSSPDSSCVFAVGGDKETMVWDIRESADARKHFKSRLDGVSMETEDEPAEMKDASAEMEEDSSEPAKKEKTEQKSEKTKKKKKPKKKPTKK